MKLLIAYDGSDCSVRALLDLYLAGLPREAEVVVVSVDETWLPPPSAYTLAVPYGESPGLEAASSLVSDACKRLERMFPAWDLRGAVCQGSPATEILARADEWAPDLIVVGSHGVSGFERVLLGSVSERVVAAAKCSVRVARGYLAEKEHPVRLLVCLDDSAGAREALHAVAARRWPEGSEALVFTVLDRSLRHHPGHDEALGHVEMLQLDAEAELQRAGLRTSRHTVEGDPRHRIPEKAGEWDANCVFVGSRGFGRIKRLLIGSVASAVVANTACSVEVIRARTEPATGGTVEESETP